MIKLGRVSKETRGVIPLPTHYEDLILFRDGDVIPKQMG